MKPLPGYSLNGIYSGSRTGIVGKDNISFEPDFTKINTADITETPATSTNNGHTYKFYSTPVTWYYAKEFCEAQGGHLVTISDSSENQFVWSICNSTRAWIGGTDRASEGTWEWVTGESFAYENWDSGEPNNSASAVGDENFLQYSGALNGQWNDASGFGKLPFVCEIEPTTYTVIYNANGGSGAPPPQTNNVGEALVLSDIVPNREGYTFLGWATSASATTAEYQPGGSFTTDADATLYAVWKQDPVVVDGASIIVGTATASPGGTVSIPVTISENPGLGAATFTVNYDSAALTFNGATKGTVMSEGTFLANPSTNIIGWNHTDPTATNGTLFTLNFTVNQSAANGTYPVSITLNELTDENGTAVPAGLTAGAVTVASGLMGDVTGDGQVGMVDALKVARSVVGYVTLTEQEKRLGDVTYDGIIGMVDALKIARYVVGYVTSLDNTAELQWEEESASLMADAVIYAQIVSAQAGKAVAVPVQIKGNPGIAAAAFAIDFDASVMNLTNITEGPVFTSEDSQFIYEAGKTELAWMNTKEDASTDGVLFTLYFSVNDSVAAGKYPITISLISNNLNNISYETINASFTPGAVEITSQPEDSSQGALRDDKTGQTVQWQYEDGTVKLTDSANALSGSLVYVAEYDSNGKMLNVQMLSAAKLAATVSDEADLVKLFWVDSAFVPRSSAADFQP